MRGTDFTPRWSFFFRSSDFRGGRAFFGSAAQLWLKYAQTSKPSVGVLKPERSKVVQTGFTLLLSLQREVLVHPAGAEELAAPSPTSWKVSFPNHNSRFPWIYLREVLASLHISTFSFLVGQICFQRSAELTFQSGVFLIQKFRNFSVCLDAEREAQMFPQFPQKSHFLSKSLSLIRINASTSNTRFTWNWLLYFCLRGSIIPSFFKPQSVNDACVAAPKPKITFDLK